VRALLDTHALLWWVTDDPRLSTPARRIIAESEVFVSTVSLWEVEIKRGLGRIAVDTEALVREVAQTIGFAILDVRPTHVLTLAKLPPLHGDPFDRMLVSQAIRERLVLVSQDGTVEKYPVEVRW